MTELTTRDINWARKITERLRLQATNYQEAREKVIHTLTEARDGGAAELLGYASWTAYMADVFADAPLRLERDARQELVAELAAQGMSTRAIAPIVGVSVSTVKTDAQVASSGHLTPEPHPSLASLPESFDVGGVTVLQTGEPVAPRTMMRANENGVVEDVPARHVTGMDGKSYAVESGGQQGVPDSGSCDVHCCDGCSGAGGYDGVVGEVVGLGG